MCSFGGQKGTEKVSAASDSARLATHNERRRPVKKSAASQQRDFFVSFLVAKKEALTGPSVIKGPAAGQAGPGGHQSKRSFKTFSQKFSQFFHHHIVLCYYYK
jgi:hypothetical protein